LYLDVGQGHEVLRDVNDELVHESRGNVVAILDVVHAQAAERINNMTLD
jgi:hypothetical protein